MLDNDNIPKGDTDTKMNDHDDPSESAKKKSNNIIEGQEVEMHDVNDYYLSGELDDDL